MMVYYYFVLGLISCYIAGILVALNLVDAVSNGDLRLVGGSTYKEGRVEMYYGSVWGTVCDDHWDYLDARVVCRQLGFGYYGTALSGSSVPDGSGEIWLDDVKCNGYESELLYCPRNAVSDHNCGHHEDAGVRCYGTPPSYSIRLVSGPGFGRYEGRLEVFHEYQWKTVCDDGWGWEESDVVCKSLGYSLGAQSYTHGAPYGQGTGEILLDDVVCTGTESSLLHCRHSGVHNHNCRHSEDIGVKCATKTYITDITVVAGILSSTSCPSGYSRYYYNLNYGAGGNYVYLCYKRGVRNPITGLNVIAGTSTSFPMQYGYTKVNVDLNSGIGRDNIYLVYTKRTTLPPIASITVRSGTTPYVYPSSTWVRIDTDCNQNAGGRYIYICYYQPRD